MIKVTLPALHAGQVSVYQRRSRFNVLQCGRRWGKTTFGEVLAAEEALEGKSVGWMSATYKYAQDVWRDMKRDLAPVISRVSEQEKRIELIGGGVIDFWTMDAPDPGRGRKYHLVILDECGIVRDLLSIWREAVRPTLADYKGQAWLLGTPKGRREFHRLFEKGQQGDEGWASFRLPTSSNPAIDPEEIAAAKRELPPAIFAQEFEGVPADDGGNPFGMLAIAECFGPVVPGKPVCYGIDLARAQDWTVVVGLSAEGHVCYFDRWQGLPWSETTKRIVNQVDAPAFVDSTGVGDAIAEDLRRQGTWQIEGFKFTSISKQQLMEGLAAALQTHAIRFDNEIIRRELECFEYEYGRTGVRYSAPSGLHDDCVCALALAVSRFTSIRHAPKPFVQSIDVHFGPDPNEFDGWNVISGGF